MQRARGVGKLWGYRKVEENWVSRPASAALLCPGAWCQLDLEEPHTWRLSWDPKGK